MKPWPMLWTVAEIRARSRVDDSGCWIWVKSRRRDGYGQINRQGTNNAAHRVAYEAAYGAIPDGLHIDHLCNVRACVNPEHLEAVTRSENLRRAWARGMRGRRVAA